MKMIYFILSNQKFVLVIKEAHDIEWLPGVRAELDERLRKIKKIWKADVIVINEDIARDYKLIY